MTKRKKIKETLKIIELEGKYTSLLLELKKIIKECEEAGYFDFEIEKDYQGYGDESYVEYNLVGTRLETDKELKKRIDKNKKNKERAKRAKEVKKQKEIKMYKKLHEKYKDTDL